MAGTVDPELHYYFDLSIGLRVLRLDEEPVNRAITILDKGCMSDSPTIDRGTLRDDGADPGDDRLVGGVLLIRLELLVGGMLGDEHHVPVTLDDAEMLTWAILNIPLRSAVAFENVSPVMDAASREAAAWP